MAKNELKKTTKKLNKLEEIIGSLSPKENTPKKSKSGVFKTSEVIILLFITLIVSFIIGGITSYKFGPINGQKVDDELAEFIKNYEYITKNYNGTINKEELIDAALSGMLGKLDKNSTFLDADSSKSFNRSLQGSYDGIGIEIYNDEEGNIVIYRVFKDSSAGKAGLKPGDIIKRINGKSMEGLKSSDIASTIKDKSKEEITIVYVRDGKEKTAKLKVGSVALPSVGSNIFEKDGKKVGYIAVSIFANNSYEQFKEQLEDLENKNINSLIIDLRGNSGGYLITAENIISLFLDSKHVIYQIEKDKNITKHYSKGNETKKYKIVVMVDENSASASEVVTSALKEQYKATVVGVKTYGKGTVQEMQSLSNGDKYKITTKNWLTSLGEWINGKGIEPDEKVELDKEYYENPAVETDHQFQKALEIATK